MSEQATRIAIYILAGAAILASVAMIVLGIVTMPERIRQERFFARNRREAMEEWERQEKGPD